jgi:redox-sensitive bicupin YhaK (pirin superfamily)
MPFMQIRNIAQLVRAQEVTEGAGVSVFRTLGTPARRHLDPFLMLDQFSTDNPDDYIAGFPEHPHRGFSTFTYMLDGHMQHADSMGNRGDLEPGGAQWMKAGSGVIHSEMPQQISGRMRGFQLWINLPAAKKMSAPAYQDIRAGQVPEVADEHARVRVLAGSYQGHTGPVSDPDTQVEYLDVSLAQGADFSHALPAGRSAFLFVFEGDVLVGDTRVPLQHLVVLGAGDRLAVHGGEDGARFLLVSGRPVGEPIVQYGPFVMNTRREIEQAMADYRDGRLVRSA